MDINELRSLIALADHGSLNAAARALDVDRTTVRRRLDALEARFEQPLLVRDRRGLELTHVGYEVLAGARKMVVQAERLFGTQARDAEPQGTLRVVTALGMPPEAYGACALFARQTMPRVSLTFSERDDPLASDLAFADVLVFWGPGSPGEDWRAAELARAPARLLASPTCIEEHGSPASVSALIDEHRILSWQAPGGLASNVIVYEEGVPRSFEPAVVCASPLSLFHMAAAGAGVALVPEGGFPIAGLAPDALVEVLPGALRQTHVLHIAYRRSLASDPRVAGMCERIEMFVAAGAGSEA